MKRKYLILSLHDVTPSSSHQLEEILGETAEFGQANLLVIPNHHGQVNISDSEHANFVQQLKALQEQGYELVHHGYLHQKDESCKSIKDRALHTVFSKQGEFQLVSEETAQEKIDLSKEIFSKAGLQLDGGFVAPAWLMNTEARAVIGRNFKYNIGFKGIYTGDQTHNAMTLGFTPRWADYFLRFYSQVVSKAFAHAEALQFSIHPQDLNKHNPFRNSAIKLLGKLAKKREVVTCKQYLKDHK
jgi:uncharacterized protein